MTTIGLYNVKGGVGKSTAVVNLAALARADGNRTLIWDLDPQGAAGFYLGRAASGKGNVKKLTAGKLNPAKLVQQTDIDDLDILPSQLSYRNFDLRLKATDSPRNALSHIIRPLAKRYRWLFIDCPPGITLLSENIYRAVDYLLVPIIPAPLSVRAYEEIIVFFSRRHLNRSLVIPFFSMVQVRRRLHRETMEFFSARESDLCRNYIPYLASIERMSTSGKPLVLAEPRSPGALAYVALWEELIARFAVRRPEA